MKTIKHTYIKLIPIACLLVTILFTTCKKFDEDKFYSWRTAKQRLEGEWQITSVLQNGNDITSQYNDSLPLSITDYYLWFNNANKFKRSDPENYFLINKSSKSRGDAFNVDVGKHGFSIVPKSSELYITSNVDPYYTPDELSRKIIINLLGGYIVAYKWKIKKLHKKNMIIESEINNNNFRISFNKTRNK